MALENVFQSEALSGQLGQQVQNDVQLADQLATDNLESQQLANTQVDYSTAESPFGDLAGLNVDMIDTEPQNTKASVTNQGGGPGDPVPANKPKPTLDQLRNTAKQLKIDQQNFGKALPEIGAKKRDAALAYGDYTFDQYVTNVDRYRGYGSETFNKIGFNPLDDNNEARYNANTTDFQDFKRMTGQFGTLFGSAFTSNYRSVYNFFTGENGLLDADQQAAEEYEKAMELGMSSKENIYAKGTNFALNMAYTAGIGVNVLLEELAIATLTAATTPLTGGSSVAAGAAATGASIARGARALERVSEIRKLVQAGLHQSSMLGGGAGMWKGGIQFFKNLKNINNAREFYTGARAAGGVFGRGALKFVNPLTGTTEVVGQAVRGEMAWKNLNNFAKMSKGFGAFYRDTRENLFAISEAQLEGGGVYNQVLDEQLKYYRETHNDQLPDQNGWATIYDNAERAGKLDTIVNVPLIFFSNRFVFDGLFRFKGISNAIDAAEEAAMKQTAKGFKFDLSTRTFSENVAGFASRMKGSILTSPKVYLGNFLNYTKANIAEGVQESLQETTGGAITKYYTEVYKNPALGGADFARASVWSSAKDNIWSAQGAEIFLNGFLMGGPMAKFNTLVTKTLTGSGELYARVFEKEKYKAYIENKGKAKAQALDALNAIMADPAKFFSRKKESIVNQYRANQNMAQAEVNDDDKTFYDSKDEKTFDHIFTALDNKTYDLVVSSLKDMGKLSDAELAQAFGLQDGTKAKDKLNEYIGRAEEIKNIYNKINNEFSNPFNPKKYKKTDSNYINEAIAYKSYEDAKKLAIASQFGFDRATQRLKDLMTDLSTNRPIMSASASDFTVLQSKDLLNNEIKILTAEVDQFDKGDKEQKEIAKKKKAKLTALIKYSNALERYQASLKSQTNVDDKGQFSIPFQEDLTNPLKEAYKEYLKTIADINDDKYVFNSKIDDSFKKVLDIYNLDKDAQNYLQNINGLANPEMFARHASVINEALRSAYEQREKIMADSIEQFFGIHEINNLTQSLAKAGVKLDPEELENMVLNGDIPTKFLDLVSGEQLDESDPKIALAQQFVQTFLDLREDRLASMNKPEEKPEQKPEEKPEEKPEKKTEKKEVVPADLASRLEAAYNEYIDNNPEADITYDEYVETSAKAANIKVQYEAEQKKGAAAVTPTPTVKLAEPTAAPAPTPTAPVSTDAKANVILPIGTSGSGKSTFIKSLPQENLVIISPDDMRIEFTGDINDKSKDKEIYIEAAKRAIEAVKNGKQVVFDTTNLTKEKRRPFIEAIKKAIPGANIQYKLMPLNVELAKQRIKADIAAGVNRANVSDETIDRHAASYPQMLEDIKKEDITEYKPVSVSTDAKADVEKEKARITASEFTELKRLAKFFLENPKEPTVSGSVVTRYPALFKAVTDIEKGRQEELLKWNEPNEARDQEINDRYNAELAALQEAKPAEPTVATTPVTSETEEIDSVEEVQTRLNEDLGVTSNIRIDTYLSGLHYVQTEDGKYYVIPDSNAAGYGDVSAKEVTKEQIIKPFRTEAEWRKVGIEVAPITIDRKTEIQKKISGLEDQIRTTNRFIGNTDSNAAIVRAEKDIELYKQELKALKEELASLEEAQPVEVVVEETSGTEKAKSILDSVSSLREMPTSKLNDNTTATANLLELVAEGKISSRDVLALVEQRRNEMLEKMNPTDLVKGDYVTFTDGRKGWVTSTNAKKNTVNVKMVGSPKGVVETINAENLRKNLTTVEKKKIVKVEPVSEEVTVSKADQETIKESRDSLEDFKNNASKIKDIEKEMLDSKKTDNSDNNNDLLDLLGCDI